MRIQPGELCCYCVAADATEQEHVIAKQFFPREGRYRGNLPQVPSCAECNRAKQRVEDTVGVLVQFGNGSPASEAVLRDRVWRTLRRNHRLRRALRAGLERTVIRLDSGVLAPTAAIKLGDNEVRHMHEWFPEVIECE